MAQSNLLLLLLLFLSNDIYGTISIRSSEIKNYSSIYSLPWYKDMRNKYSFEIKSQRKWNSDLIRSLYGKRYIYRCCISSYDMLCALCVLCIDCLVQIRYSKHSIEIFLEKGNVKCSWIVLLFVCSFDFLFV